MTQLRFDAFTQAYRERHSDELDDHALLGRIQGTLSVRAEQRLPKRLMTWLYGLGLTTALGATLAYASPLGPTLLQWVTTTLAAPSTTHVATHPGATTPPNDNASSVTPVAAPALPAPLSLPNTTTAPSNPAPSVRHSSSADEVAPSATRKAIAQRPARAASDDAPMLYAKAHELQFSEHSYTAAIAAWDRYLATTDVALKEDARYNRAVCLVHLKQYDRARVELTQLSGAGSARAYRSRALTLLRSMEARVE